MSTPTPARAPTIYQTIAPDGTIRLACHRMRSAPCWWGTKTKPSIRFRYRVLASFNDFPWTHGEFRRSCRGQQYVRRELLMNAFDTEDDAIRWLVDGDRR
jgi:hypothetical protein